MREDIRGITLIRPWGWAILHAGKDVENRGPRFPAPPVGSWLAIHNGQKWSAEDAERVRSMVPVDLVMPTDHPPMHIIGLAQVEAVTRAGAVHRESPWYFGETGIWLCNPTPIKPIHCRGALGLWRLPSPVLDQVRAAWREARRAT